MTQEYYIETTYSHIWEHFTCLPSLHMHYISSIVQILDQTIHKCTKLDPLYYFVLIPLTFVTTLTTKLKTTINANNNI